MILKLCFFFYLKDKLTCLRSLRCFSRCSIPLAMIKSFTPFSLCTISSCPVNIKRAYNIKDNLVVDADNIQKCKCVE